MTILDTTQAWLFLQTKHVDEYWEMVRLTIQRVFDADTKHVDDLRSAITSRPEEEQVLFYHAEPFDVAADLAARSKSVKAAEERLYEELAKSRGWHRISGHP